jgi:hypothetical protein
LRGLRQRRHDQRVTRVDRHHRRADAETRDGRADHRCEGDRVVIVLLAHPHLADAEFVGTGRLRHHVIDTVDGLRVGKQHNSSRHNNENAPAVLDHPVLPRLSEALPRSPSRNSSRSQHDWLVPVEMPC